MVSPFVWIPMDRLSVEAVLVTNGGCLEVE